MDRIHSTGADPADAAPTPVRASDILAELLRGGLPGIISLHWLTARFEERSFGAYILLFGVIGLLPFVSMPAGILVGVLAVQLIAGMKNPVLPPFIGRKSFPSRRIARPLERAIGWVRRLESCVYPRWPAVFVARRIVGAVIFLLALGLLVPIPFSNVVPALAIVLIALAYLERDGVLLSLSLFASALALALGGFAIWGLVRSAL